MRKHRQSTYLVEPIMSMYRCHWVALTDRSFFFTTRILRAVIAIDRGLANLCPFRSLPPVRQSLLGQPWANDAAAADREAGTNKNHNNQPNERFNKHLGRVSMRLWVDWAAVALLVSLLVSGPFSCGPPKVDCCDMCFLIQQSSDEAETFT